MLVCARCNHIDPRPSISFCPRCRGPLQYVLPGATESPSDWSSSPVALSVNNQPLLRQGSKQPKAMTPGSISQELYRAHASLMRGDPIWQWIGKHLSAHQTREQARESLDDLAKLQKETFVRTRQQVIDAELERRNAEFGDSILREQLSRRADMLANYLDHLNQLFTADRYASVPDEIKADIVNSLFKQAEEMVFTATNPMANGQTPAEDDNAETVVDADEF